MKYISQLLSPFISLLFPYFLWVAKGEADYRHNERGDRWHVVRIGGNHVSFMWRGKERVIRFGKRFYLFNNDIENGYNRIISRINHKKMGKKISNLDISQACIYKTK